MTANMRLFTKMHPVFLLLTVAFLMPSACSEDAAPVYAPAVKAIDASGFEGAVLIYDMNEDTYASAYAELATQPFIPASTFKIFSTLVALETGVIDGKESIIEWDGVVRNREAINRDLDLQSAFRVSAVPHYQQMVREIGEERMQKYIDEAGYGNQDISGGIDQFWLTGGLRISATEQIDFLMRLYRKELPFSSATMATVKEIMEHEAHENYLIRAKTGWGIPEEGNHFGWWVGWVEKGENVYAFATVLNTQSPGDNFGTARIAITKEVLAGLGIIEDE